MTAAEAKAEPTTAPPLIPLKGLRGAIARNMSAGWQAPRVAMGADVDLTLALRLLAERKTVDTGGRVTVTALVLHAVAQALRARPAMNSLMREGGIERAGAIHLGLAVALDEGLAVPVIRDADRLGVEALAAAATELATGARAGTLAPRSFQGGTFTVTNLGATGIDWFTPILNPPQIGILGMSRILERPAVREGAIAVRSMTTLTLVFDHRALDGHPAALFLRDVRERLEACEGL